MKIFKLKRAANALSAGGAIQARLARRYIYPRESKVAGEIRLLIAGFFLRRPIRLNLVDNFARVAVLIESGKAIVPQSSKVRW